MPKNSKKQDNKVNSWSLAGTFRTFEEADQKRNKIAENESVQTKVRRRDSKNSFTVHYRNKQTTPKKSGKKNEDR